MSESDSAANPNAGHRARLRDRFLNSGAAALADYELLELLLFGAMPRADTKPLAKRLLKEFGSLEGVLDASPEKLRAAFPKAPALIATLRLASTLAERVSRARVINRPVFTAWSNVLDYCQLTMARLPHEELRLLYLDGKNALKAEEVHQRGTVDQTPAYPREIVKRALEEGAASIILVHNHPTGDPMPSKQDLALTKAVQQAGATLGIAVHDHIIIGHGSHFSFKAEGLL